MKYANRALYESLISEALIKSGLKLYFYKNIEAIVELDFYQVGSSFDPNISKKKIIKI